MTDNFFFFLIEFVTHRDMFCFAKFELTQFASVMNKSMCIHNMIFVEINILFFYPYYEISPRALCGIILPIFKNYLCANLPLARGPRRRWALLRQIGPVGLRPALIYKPHARKLH